MIEIGELTECENELRVFIKKQVILTELFESKVQSITKKYIARVITLLLPCSLK